MASWGPSHDPIGHLQLSTQQNRCVVCILDYPLHTTLPYARNIFNYPFCSWQKRRMKERKHLQQWFQFLIIDYYYRNRDENISTDVFDFLFYLESGFFMTFHIQRSTVVKEYISDSIQRDTKAYLRNARNHILVVYCWIHFTTLSPL